MAQGKTKLASKPSSGGRPNNGAMRKGKRVIPPKARSEINRKIMQQSLSAKINNSIERQMVAAASTGKLTIMKNVATDLRPESWSAKAVEAKKAASRGAPTPQK